LIQISDLIEESEIPEHDRSCSGDEERGENKFSITISKIITNIP